MDGGRALSLTVREPDLYVGGRILNMATGDKTFLSWFRGYLVVVSKEPSPAVTSSVVSDSGPGREASPGEGSPQAFGAEGVAGTVLTLYDLKNKFVAYSGTFGTSEGGSPKAIKSVLGEWGELFVITDDKKVSHFLVGPH